MKHSEKDTKVGMIKEGVLDRDLNVYVLLYIYGRQCQTKHHGGPGGLLGNEAFTATDTNVGATKEGVLNRSWSVEYMCRLLLFLVRFPPLSFFFPYFLQCHYRVPVLWGTIRPLSGGRNLVV